MTKRQKWLRLIAWLKKTFPARYPVYVRSVKMKDAGEISYVPCANHPRSFQIRINRNKSYDTRVDTLLHEWAHALTWFGADLDDVHGGEWGLSHARIYSAWEKWQEEMR